MLAYKRVEPSRGGAPSFVSDMFTHFCEAADGRAASLAAPGAAALGVSEVRSELV